MAETINLGIVGIKNMGEYDSQTQYEKLNVVTYQGSTYCSLKSVKGILPTNTEYWQLYAEKGSTGPEGPKPIKGVDYFTEEDKTAIENELKPIISVDVTDEVSSQLDNLTSATPLAANSVSGMTDTTRIYVNTTDGHWYWYNGNSWEDGGVYQATNSPDTNGIDNITDNLLLNTKLWPWGYVTATGAVNKAHDVELNTKLSNFTPIKPNTIYTFIWSTICEQSDVSWIRCAFYDEDKSFISAVEVDRTNDNYYPEGYRTGYQIFTSPANAKYIRCSYREFDGGNAKLYEGSIISKYSNNIYNEISLQLNNFNLIPNIYTWLKGYYSSYVGHEGQPISIVSPSSIFNEKRTDFIKVKPNNFYTFQMWFEEQPIDAGGSWLRFNYFSDANLSSPISSQDYNNANKQEIYTLEQLDNGIWYALIIFKTPQNCEYLTVSTRTYGKENFYTKLEDGLISSAYTIDEKDLYEYFNKKIKDAEIKNNETNLTIKSIAHRGYSTEAPENTLPAYKLAKQKGFLYGECDVSFTSDNVPVLLHDPTIDRTSNGTGNISSLTFEQVRQYDFGSWKAEKYTGTTIPSFEEFIILCRDIGLNPYIEIKNNETYTQSQIELLVNICKKYGMLDKSTWISFSLDYLTIIKDLVPNARLGFLYFVDANPSGVAACQNLKTGTNYVFFDLPYNHLTDYGVALCANGDIPIEIWTVDDTDIILNMDKYISGVTSNILQADKIIYNSNME